MLVAFQDNYSGSLVQVRMWPETDVGGALQMDRGSDMYGVQGAQITERQAPEPASAKHEWWSQSCR